ncbi:MAG TPA: DNA translocase FtsK [Kiritimatiellia bacterium]|nr:DNA translocase FtsK [Kiritimatiellia bacterium]HPS06451.1 DNA translocase FtsK [Kiritimatiellia bacterium]
MDEFSIDKSQDRLELDRRIHRRVAGILLFPIALFPLLSLITYNWRDISWLNAPPLDPPANLIGVVGAWSVFIGYSLMGLTVWLVPVFVLVFSGMLLYGRIVRIGRRAFWMILFIVALCCLVQLGSATVFDGALERLNLKPNAGGAIGYWIMTRLLARWFSPVGGGMLMISIMLFALAMAIGLRTLFAGLGRLTGWWEARQAAGEASDAGFSPAVADDGLTPRERERMQRQAIKEAARRARDEARLAREEERRRESETRKAERQRKLDAQNEQAQTAQNDGARNERREAVDYVQAADLIRRRAEEARQVAAAERERERQRAASASAVAAPETDPPVRKRAAIAPPPAPAEVESAPNLADYPLPSVELLNPIPRGTADHGNIEETAAVLVETLKQFNVPVEVVGTTPGPVVTQYELRPAPNIKVERIASLTANLQMALEATSLRVQAPIPGKNAVGIEIPNRRARPVTFREVVEGESWRHCKLEVPLVLGKDVAGNDLIYDLAKAPHLLVAGATGSGKSVCLNAILNGFLMSRTPEQLRLILVDPKRVEFTCYNELPHLLVPVINDPKKVAFGLRWAIMEMEKRYRLLQKVGCRNIVAFNNRQVAMQEELFDESGAEAKPAASTDDVPARLPYIVIVVDEVADIMSAVGKEVEPAISRLTSLSRAVGIHLILATQRPSVDVITGTIKANIPGRIAFKVSQANDSRTILDSPGAEELIGKGDMLFLKEGSQLMRAQGAWVGDDEIARVVAFVKDHCRPCYDQTLIGRLDKIKESDPDAAMDEDDEAPAGEAEGTAAEEDADDALMPNALEVIRMTRRASTTMLQRRLGIGYTRAARLMDTLEARGVVGPQVGSGTREILVDLDNEIPTNTGFSNTPDEAGPASEATSEEDENATV